MVTSRLHRSNFYWVCMCRSAVLYSITWKHSLVMQETRGVSLHPFQKWSPSVRITPCLAVLFFFHFTRNYVCNTVWYRLPASKWRTVQPCLTRPQELDWNMRCDGACQDYCAVHVLQSDNLAYNAPKIRHHSLTSLLAFHNAFSLSFVQSTRVKQEQFTHALHDKSTPRLAFKYYCPVYLHVVRNSRETRLTCFV